MELTSTVLLSVFCAVNVILTAAVPTGHLNRILIPNGSASPNVPASSFQGELRRDKRSGEEGTAGLLQTLMKMLSLMKMLQGAAPAAAAADPASPPAVGSEAAPESAPPPPGDAAASGGMTPAQMMQLLTLMSAMNAGSDEADNRAQGYDFA